MPTRIPPAARSPPPVPPRRDGRPVLPHQHQWAEERVAGGRTGSASQTAATGGGPLHPDALPPFAQRLRARARHLGLSDAEVARRAGLGQPRYSNYCNGLREPDLATLVVVAKALETTPDRLLGVTHAEEDDQTSSSVARTHAVEGSLHRDLQDLVALLPADRHPLALALLRAVLHDTDASADRTTKGHTPTTTAEGAGRPVPAATGRMSKPKS
ncbi:helix-turn-helix domain-containing protein [Roseococcus sp. DSY-14]|uniref:helix-turn-helix domain-containing protein n=1 Tax=Roseococcus sp. DSY-14 TaxID=3369650 RepID=UPI00387B2370